MDKIKVALIGFGGIARFHNAAYKELAERGVPIELVAVCDRNIAQFTRNITTNLGGGDSRLPENVHTYTDVDEMLANEDFDMADICLPSFLHKDFAVKLLSAGKHVFCEKPMALSPEDADEMLLAAKKAERRLMVGLCLHFTPAYRYLGEAIREKHYGRLEYLRLWRNSTFPNWGAGDHFTNRKKSGGLILDMHVHDVDIVHHFLGEPASIDVLTYDNLPHCQTVSTLLYYPDLPVKIDSCWDKAFLYPFDAGFDAKFERAALFCEGDGAKLTLIRYDGEPEAVELPDADCYVEELGYMAELILHPEMENTLADPHETAKITRMMANIQRIGDEKAAAFHYSR